MNIIAPERPRRLMTNGRGSGVYNGLRKVGGYPSDLLYYYSLSPTVTDANALRPRKGDPLTYSETADTPDRDGVDSPGPHVYFSPEGYLWGIGGQVVAGQEISKVMTDAELAALGSGIYTQFIPHSEPSLLVQFSSQIGISIAASAGEMAALAENVIVFGDNSTQRLAYQDIDNVSTSQIISAYVSMDDGNAPVIGSSISTGDFSLVANSTILAIGVTITHVSGSIYRVSATRAATGVGAKFGIAKYVGQSARSFKITRINVTRTGSLEEYVKTIGVAATGGKAVMTVSCLIVPGFNGADLPDNTFNIPVMAANGVAGYVPIGMAKSGSSMTVVSSDGVSFASMAASVNDGEPLLVCMRTSADGTQFQVGSRLYNPDMSPDDASIVWGSLTTSDGQFDPIESFQIFLDTLHETYVRMIQIWNKSCTDAEILKYVPGVQEVEFPTEDLVAAFWVANNLVDSIGLLSITMTTGTIADLPNATWGFPSDAATLQADSDLGGDAFFDSANAMAPIVRSGAEWYALLNETHVWIGFHLTRGGIVIYTNSMAAKETQILNYLGRYSPVVSFNELTEEQFNALTEEQFNNLSI